MDQVREYLLSVTAAVILCAIVRQIVGEKGSMAKMVKIISGVFVAVTMISPLAVIRLDTLTDPLDHFMEEGETVTQAGTMMANEAMADIIKQQIEAYILDEADRQSLAVSVDVSLKNDDNFLPEKVSINGAISPYQKRRFSQFLEDQLGISQENQEWT